MLATRAANYVLQNCDFLLAIGARLDQNLVAYAPRNLARGAIKAMVNIDDAEIERLHGVIDIPVCADAGEFIEELLGYAREGSYAREPWLSRCRAWRSSYPFVTADSTKCADDAGLLSVYRFSRALSDELSEGDVVLPGSSGAACEVFLTALQTKPGQRVFHNKGTGAMGFGPPAAIGACLAAGGRRVICVDGDGGFQFNAQELETIKRLRLPIKFFVVDNAGYACIRQSQANHFGRLAGADEPSGLTLPPVRGVARAYGIPASRVSNRAGLRRRLRAVLTAEGPHICEVTVAPDEERMPRVQSAVRPDGSLVSRPLEDMWPFLPRDEYLSNMIVRPVEE